LTDALPAGILKAFVQYAAHSIQVHEDMILMNMLGGINTALNGKIAIKLGNQPPQPVQLYLLLIANPGERKSPAAAVSMRPVGKWLKDRCDQRLYFDDSSGSGLVQAMTSNGGRLACHDPEPQLLHSICRGGIPVTTLCKAYEGESLHIDRSRQKPIFVPDPAISLCISSQPNSALQFGRNQKVRASGLLARMLFLLPQPMAGTRIIDVPPIPAEAEAHYERLIYQMLEYTPSAAERCVLTLEPAAESEFRAFAQEIEWGLVPGGPFSFDTAWSAKLAGKVARLASLLHCASHELPWGMPITCDTVRQAVFMARVFMGHAQRVFFLVDHGEVWEAAGAIEQWARFSLKASFSAQDASMALPSFPRKLIMASIDMLLRHERIYEDFSFLNGEVTVRRGRVRAPRYRLANGGQA